MDLPCKTELKNYTDKDIQDLALMYNNTPRKRLEYQIPNPEPQTSNRKRIRCGTLIVNVAADCLRSYQRQLHGRALDPYFQCNIDVFDEYFGGRLVNKVFSQR